MATIERQADEAARKGRLLRALCHLSNRENIEIPPLQCSDRIIEKFGGDFLRSQRLERIVAWWTNALELKDNTGTAGSALEDASHAAEVSQFQPDIRKQASP
jgi:hypothetical protein